MSDRRPPRPSAPSSSARPSSTPSRPPAATPSEHVGGSPANVAFGLAALEHPVDLATWIATDERGRRIEDVCRERGVTLTAGLPGRTLHLRRPRDARRHGRRDLRLRPRVAGGRGPRPHGIRPRPHGQHRRRARARRRPGARAPGGGPRARAPRCPTTPTRGRRSWGDPEQARHLIESSIALADVVKLSDEDVEWLCPGEALDDVMRAWGALGPAARRHDPRRRGRGRPRHPHR